MTDQKNTILAIVLSALVLIGWQLYFGLPQVEKQKQIQQQQAQEHAQPGPRAPQAVPSTQAPPAAAPQASSTFRSTAVVCSTCPTSDPIAPPVWMIGPSAPNGPPVPIAIAAEIGFSSATRGAMRLRFTNTASIASGMPWPRIFDVPYLAISPTARPPSAGATSTQAPSVC